MRSRLNLLFTAIVFIQSEKAFAQQSFLQTYKSAPLAFEVNRGQSDSHVQYLSRGRAFTMFFTSEEMILDLGHATVTTRLAGASETTSIEGIDLLPVTTNYYIGNDPSGWRKDIPSYRRLV